MNASRRWLEEMLRRPLDLRELVDRFAMLGAPVDAVVSLDAGLADIVVALVEEVRPHPKADRLHLCTVNDGTTERRKVVCGAANVVAGGRYPFAPIGASLPGGLVIEKRKLRGEVSEGMLCSSRELGLGADADGLMTLETDAAPGTRLSDLLALGDDRLVLDVPPTRPDLLGHKGIARELGAAYGVQFRLTEIPGASDLNLPSFRPSVLPSGVVGGVVVSIEPPAACARFTGAVIRGVRVGPSPDWLRRRLEAVGTRSISNVVDATNYVMFELGQPLHAYDLARVQGPALIVRLAQAGERLTTLDGVDRALAAGTTVVGDRSGIAGIGGVMGGRSSYVSESTTDVFLEAAWWHPGPLRKARKALGLPTEASQRFERGTDLWAIPDALRRAVEIVLATAGGTLDGEPLDLWPAPSHPPRIFLRAARSAQVLGAELPVHELERCLVAIGATVVSKPAEGRLAVDVPGWRPDLREEIDLVEEVARIHGYDGFPDALRPFRPGNQTDAPIAIAADHVRRGMIAEGLFEVILLPVGPPDALDAVPILNPLSAEHGHLRGRLLPGLLRQVEANWANQVRDIRLFEVGTVFRPGPGGRPAEATHAAAVMTGARTPAHWTDGGHPSECDRWDLKGLFERAVSLAIPGATVQVDGDGWTARLPSPEGREVGRAGSLAADAPPWAAPVFGLEVLVDPAPRQVPRYSPLPATPAAIRDLALLLPGGMTVARVLGVVRESGGALLESVRVLDEYRGAELPAGRRSVALRLVLRGKERTLREADVDAVIQRLLTNLGQALDVTLRTA
ncbi:MAG TPA: phenylalanine--tRNA ligase subunit beta [Gemmatimonadales bacterium]|nr:phenylalanine--tRNA ligase subunit beta [Gemmatimonadales bacterium]